MVGHLQSLEPRWAVEGEVDLVVIQDVEHEHVVPRLRSSFSPRNSPSRSMSKSETSTIIPRRGKLSTAWRRMGKRSVLSAGGRRPGADDGVEVVAAGPLGNGRPRLLVEGQAAHRVLLAEHEIGEAGGQRAGVLVLGHRPGAVRMLAET